MMSDEEIDETLWEQKRQNCIKRLKELPVGHHFIVTTQVIDDHSRQHTTIAGCTPWLLEASRNIVMIGLGLKDTTEG